MLKLLDPAETFKFGDMNHI